MTRALVLLALAACGGTRPAARPERGPAGTESKDAGPRGLADDLPALAARTAAMTTALADALAGDGDCAALAAAARTVLADHADVRAAAAAVVQRGDGPALDEALAAHADAITAAAARMQPALDRCGADADFAAALTPFDTPE